MSGAAIVTMILVLGIIWGGFVVTLVIALRSEQSKPAPPERKSGTET